MLDYSVDLIRVHRGCSILLADQLGLDQLVNAPRKRSRRHIDAHSWQHAFRKCHCPLVPVDLLDGRADVNIPSALDFDTILAVWSILTGVLSKTLGLLLSPKALEAGAGRPHLLGLESCFYYVKWIC